MADNELERIYTIPLRDVKHGSRNKMANRAVREVRSFLNRHMKSEDIWIDDAVNRAIWANGMYKVPSKIRVRAVKFEDGVVEVSLPEEEASTSIRQQLQEERESKAPILPTPTMETEEEESEVGEIEAEPEEAEAEKPQTAAEEKDDKAPEGTESAEPDVSAKDTRAKPGDEA
jgi:large subunit ribosomal protein L31e